MSEQETPTNWAQGWMALLLHGKLQSGGRDYKADHALRGTPARPAKNVTYIDGFDDERVPVTRGQRKLTARFVGIRNHQALAGQPLPDRHIHPRRLRAAAA